MSDSKNSNGSKKINIKNKKEAKKVLNRKNNTIAKKSIKKSDSKTEKTLKLKEKENKIIDIEKKIDKEKSVSKKKSPIKNTEKKKVNKQKKKEEIKLILPKEWQKTNSKNKTLKTKVSKNTTTLDISSKLKESIFEEVDIKQAEKELIERKKNRKKHIIITIIMLLLIAIITLILLKYKDLFGEKLKIYPEYFIGEKYTLNDGNNWYVVEDSPQNVSTVKFLRESPLDISNDGKLDSVDKDKYYSSNINIYDDLDENSVAYRLNNTYKSQIELSIGKVEKISLLTSKEFVKLRDKMGYGYEWSEGNWLANNNIGTWWIISSQKDKVYAVSTTGAYRLYNATDKNYVRPVITVKKDNLKK